MFTENAVMLEAIITLFDYLQGNSERVESELATCPLTLNSLGSLELPSYQDHCILCLQLPGATTVCFLGMVHCMFF